MTVTYVTYAQMCKDVVEFVRFLPRSLVNDLCGVVGVPRSGMLPAVVLANHLHLPVADLWGFFRSGGGFSGAGQRLKSFPPGNKVLVIDDSAYGGRTMDMAREVCKMLPYDCFFTCLYRNPEKNPPLDSYFKDVSLPRCFEWNVMQHQDIGSFMLDIDGILCYDPPVVDDDGKEYQTALINAEPLYIPKRKVHSLCTNRLTKWRQITQDWLERQHISYAEIYTRDFDTADERRGAGAYGKWKGEVYAKSPCCLLIESSQEQAKLASKVSNKPVLCLTSGEVFQ